MTIPRTRLDEGENEFERDLLRSWQTEAPSPELRQRVLALGAAGTLAGATTAATGATGVAGASAGAGTLGAQGSAVAGATLGKWLLGGAVLVSSGVLAVPYLRPSGATRAEPAAAAAGTRSDATAKPANSPVPPGRAPLVAEPPAQPEPQAAPGGGAAQARPTPRATSLSTTTAEATTASPSASHRPSLGEETGTLDRAQRALASGDTAEALRQIDEHDRRFAGGMLSQEATVVRIEALWKSGQRERARALAAQLVAAHPNSPHAAKLRRTLGGENP